MAILKAHVIWGDGLEDTPRDCLICDTRTCINPVHIERYKTVSDVLAKRWDEENPVI